MFPFTLIFVPALMAQAPEAPTIVDLGHGVQVLKGAPTATLVEEIKRLHISQVIDFRDDAEFGSTNVGSAATGAGAAYMRYALNRTPPAGDFEFIREILSGLRGARVLLLCRDGNRAAAAACPWLVLDKGMHLEDALKLCRQAGLRLPETEEAVRRYIGTQAKA